MKNFYKSILAVTFLTVLSLTACGNNEKNVDTKKVSDVTGVTYKVGMDSDYPPYEFIGEQGKPTGFEVELLQAIADDQKVKVTFMPMPWSLLLKGLSKNEYDIVIGGISEEDVEKDYSTNDFLYPKSHVYAQDTIVALEKNAISAPKKFRDLEEHKVATVADTSWIIELNDVVKEENIVAKKTSFLALQALMQGKVDVMLNEKGVMRYYQKTIPEIPTTLYSEDDYFEPYELITVANKDKKELVKVFNKGLKNIVNSGQYTRIYKKWFGEEPIKMPRV